ncbi:MAG: polysaccharide biosynthesis protein [Acidobacteria bacterium]|nr:polysaccharide biosynthesis protein [Acidobacteriota bacterium]
MTTRRLLLIGAGYTARLVADEFVRHQRGQELVVALDDDAALRDGRVGPAAVVGPIAALDAAVVDYAIDEVIVAIPSLSGVRLREITIACRRLGLPVRTMPAIVELLGRPITPRQLRPVEVADLLRRTEVRCDEPPPAYLSGQRVLITGAGGSIGRELARQVCRAQPESLVLLGRGENSIHAAHIELAADPMAPPLVPVIADVTDERALSRVFATHAPTLVFHAAAHKHVPLMEAHPAEAVRNNIVGTWNVVRCAESSGVARLLLVSTDKAVAPASVMGATKRVCEWIVGDAGARVGRPWVAVRFGNVLGSRGSVVPLLEQQIARGGPVTLTHPEMSRFFMTIPEAVYLVLHAGGMDDGGRLYVLDMGAPVRIVDLAADLIQLSGEDPDTIRVVFTGLRPGEKLTEILWEDGSRVLPTSLSALLRVEEPQAPTGDRLHEMVRGLASLARQGDAHAIRQALQAAVPGSSPALALTGA